ncbi:biotin-dependent carboxylase-like uncharacterized protein [Trinickia symbiotica]|uniref:MFS transporter n=1 Tax=Trinickia symbiotica TaxID=863227 RepID=UPI0003A22484|nr:MFS transporter [Trinickia symbiotica]PPK47093.1 biotin-dependent carboxylase-like uncharacterized protein [Trinickia symbiotica]
MSIEVLKPGALTTLQDLGRRGFQKLGVPVNGVMDERSHRLANVLVGNAQSEGTLEVTLMGPTLRFTSDAVIAVTGADLDAKLNGEPLALNKATRVTAGSELAFGKRRSGVRAYIAVRGGYHADLIMGSASLFARGGYGGFAGRALAKGSVIELKDAAKSDVQLPNPQLAALSQDVLWDADASIRVIVGREWELFNAASQEAFQQEAFRLTPQSDRMGFRLEGPKLDLRQPTQMKSEALGFGAIQVPADGNPIVLMADRQTTGGYPKIAHVCAADSAATRSKDAGRVGPVQCYQHRGRSADQERLNSRTFAAWGALSTMFRRAVETSEPVKAPLSDVLRNHRPAMLRVFLISFAQNVGYWVGFVFMSIYLITYLKYDKTTVYWSMSAVSITMAMLMPMWGGLSDRIGRKKVLSIGFAAYAILVFPMMALMNLHNTVLTLIALFVVALPMPIVQSVGYPT